MKIVDVNEFYSPTGGGVRTYLDRKMSILAQRGHELIVVAPGREDSEEERPGGGRIVYRRSPGMPFDKNYGLFWDAAPIHALLDRFDPDVVECSSPWRPAWIVADWPGRAMKSYFFHGDNLEAYPKIYLERFASGERIERAFGWYDRYMTRFLARFDTVLTNGPALARRLRARHVRVDAAMTLGIERRHFSPTLRDPAVRAELLAQCDLPPSAHLLLGIGRHHREKQWPLVIDAVQRAGATLPIGLVLFGQGLATKMLEKHVGDSPHIRLFRPVYDRSRLARIMASTDALIHGASAEPFGLVAYEALASGAPMIVPDEGGAFEASAPAYAESFRAKDVVSCAEAIIRFFARDQTAMRTAAADAAARVRSDEDHAEALVAHYEGVIAAKRV
ncbi:MAG: glycosyltransferase family 1 protein [Sphingomonas bacterium]|uniref:glycosyltransferase n=1 Tax=Sphingomonas bacterium TaxID=1895847 RepID=UPI0026244B8E|nr:glycosyltransferase [Sphingomonas bacterium]MDB5694497.1 glycosyltransferase family 1 protein [Sphingomonas bacterium]